jgi:RNA polymerase sigma factor (TIGR02999 family)
MDQTPRAQDSWALLMTAAEAGSLGAKEQLFAALYKELHQLAERQLHRSNAVYISPTTLLHETYLDIAAGQALFVDRARFMGYAARVMRSLIIDFMRMHRAQKRGAEFHITRLDDHIVEQRAESQLDELQLVRLSDALEELASHSPALAEVVDLKYFCGFSLTEIAALRAVSERTVQRDWDKARVFLHRELKV